MKSGFIGAAALGLATLAIAQPHGIRHVHKRDQVHTVVDYVTVEREEIVVYLDEDSKPVATSTFWSGMVPTPAPSSSSSSIAAAFHEVATSSSQEPKPAAPSTSSQAPPPPPPPPSSSPAPAPASTSAQSGSSSGSSSSPSSGSSGNTGSSSGGSSDYNFGRGVSYSPYQSDNSCKSASDMKSDLGSIDSSYDVIRLYGTDCDQVGNMIQALSGRNTKIFAGVFDIGSYGKEVQTIIDAVKSNGGNWDVIHTVSIGNELVNDKKASVDTVKSAVSSARSTLRSAGFNGPVVTVDTMVAMKSNPDLSSTSDYLAMNCHPFFDGNTVAENSGQFIQGWINQLSGIANGKGIVITETGWPWRGNANKDAVPSVQNQQAAISSIKNALSSNVILYSAFDQLWMQNSADTYNAEQWWGMNHNQ